MNNIYDNGYQLLGNKKMLEEYTKKNMEHMKKVGDDYVVETCEEILEILQQYEDDNMVFMIDYDNGMGFTYKIWDAKDIINK